MTQYVYGKNVVRQLLAGTRCKSLFLSIQDKEIEKEANRKHIPVIHTDRKTLTKKVGNDTHNGYVAEIIPYETMSLEALLKKKKKDEYGLIVMLDQLEDPHNLGAILRTCDAIGADGVIYKKDRSVGLTPTVAKVSAGAIETIPCVEVVNLSRTIETLKENGYWIIGADMDGEDYRLSKYDFNVCLVIGNEGKGLSRLVEEGCDKKVSLPMVGEISSLNASVSASILLYQIYAQRHPL